MSEKIDLPQNSPEKLTDDIVNQVRDENFNKEQITDLIPKLQQIVPFNKKDGNVQEQTDIEKLRLELCEKAKQILADCSNEIEIFNLMTTSRETNGSCSTYDMGMVQYNRNHNNDYETFNVDTDGERSPYHKNGYVYNTRTNIITLSGYLGRALHTPDRPGNGFDITILFKKSALNARVVIKSVMDVLNTLKPYNTNYRETGITEVYDRRELEKQDIKNIAKEGLPILEAFRDIASREISPKFEINRGNISMDRLIEEYKEIISQD